MVRMGAKRENIILVDMHGVVYKGRTIDMNPWKERLACDSDKRTLAEALEDADVFYGLAVADILTPEMVKTMAEKPLIFAMANPDPEIRYELAKEARPDAIVATGRSDYPNQINNVLGFPFIFRGALDVRARAINDEMKLAASKALAELTKQDVPDSVLRAYGLDALKFGPDYIIPKPLDPRVMLWESPAVAEAAMTTGVARKPIDLDAYCDQLTSRLGMGEQVRSFIMNSARAAMPKKRIVFAEGEEVKILRAAAQIVEEDIGVPILVGREAVIREKLKTLGIAHNFQVIEPQSFPRFEQYAQEYSRLRQRKGVNIYQARRRMLEPNVFTAMLVKMGEADASVSGLTFDYPDVIRPALRIHHTQAGKRIATGVYIMIVGRRTYLFTDATVNIEPSAEDLADIAFLAADFARKLCIEPRVALLSFSNFGSTPHPLAEKVRLAVDLIRSRGADFPVDGEMQADTAVIPALIEERYPFSQVKDANVLVFPSLEAANIAYKLLARLGTAQAIGPILLGVGAPVHVLQTGDEVRNIVNIAAVAVMDAEGREKANRGCTQMHTDN